MSLAATLSQYCTYVDLCLFKIQVPVSKPAIGETSALPHYCLLTIAQLTGTTYSNLTFSDRTVWLACCLLSCTDCLILPCDKDWKGEVSVITLGGSFSVCFHKAACRQNSDDNLCVWHIYWCCLSNWPRSALLKYSGLWIVGFSNTYIKPHANKPQTHPINLWFFGASGGRTQS